jgi:hypothetical protein
MAIHMLCSCGQELVTEDQHAGRKVRCPSCQGIIVVPGTRKAPVGGAASRRDRRQREEVDEDEDDRPRREGGLSTNARLGRARIGLGLHWGKTLCFLIIAAFSLLGSLVLLVMTFVAMANRGAPGGGGGAAGINVIGILGCIGVIAVFVMPVLGAVGSLMCFWLPERSGGRVLSMVACGLDSFAFLSLIVAFIMYIAAVTSAVSAAGMGRFSLENIVMAGGFITVLIIAMYVFLLAGWILHMLVLRNLAAYARDRFYRGSALRMMIFGLVTLIVPGIIIYALTLIFSGARAGIAAVLVIEFLLIAWTGSLLAVSFKVLNLINAVRALI